jgi:hypothetical protein
MKTNLKNNETKNNVKEVILNSKNLMNDENLLNMNLESLDETNLDLLVSNISKNIKQKTNSKEKIYKIVVDKKVRQQIRKKRNQFIDNVLFFKSQKNEIELKKEIENFNKFYKETYLLNDYSENSICQNNSDNETKIKVKVFLQIVKTFKSK